MKITKITMINFKNYVQQTYTFHDQTVVMGKNGEGKTTIAEAIAWCLFGSDLTGATKQDQKLLRLGKKEMSVTIDCESDAGEALNISRIKGKSTTLLVNGHKDDRGLVPTLFGEVRDFLSMFYPGYFSRLEPKDARSVIGKCIHDVDRSVVLVSLTVKEREAISSFPMLGGLDSVALLLDKYRKELRKQQDEIKNMEGQRSMAASLLAGTHSQQPIKRINDVRRKQYVQDKESLANTAGESKQRQTMIAQLEARRKSLRVSYEALKSELQTMEETCPTCGQPLQPAKVQEIRVQMASHNAKINRQMKALIAEGNQVKVDIEHWLAVPEAHEVDPIIQARIAQYEQDERLDVQEAAKYTAQAQMVANATQKMESVDNDLSVIASDIIRLEGIIQALGSYRVAYVRMQHEKLNTHFRKVQIHLMDVNKETGEIKDVFRIEWKGRPYRLLSNSESIRCDIEIGQALAAARGETMPTFVDNAESVQRLFDEIFTGQVIAAYVAECALAVEMFTSVESPDHPIKRSA